MCLSLALGVQCGAKLVWVWQLAWKECFRCSQDAGCHVFLSQSLSLQVAPGAGQPPRCSLTFKLRPAPSARIDLTGELDAAGHAVFARR